MKNSLFLFIFIIVILISTLFVPVISVVDCNNINYTYNYPISYNGEYIWPIPGHTKISSPFGKRKSPTSGASTYHKGTDIPAPVGTPLYAVADGYITFTDFLGGGGYTITLSISEEIKVTYCHVSPEYIVSKGDFVEQGQQIGNVGPKNVYGVAGNKYKDTNGNPTNGATTGPHLHIGFRINGKYVNPMDYLSY